MAVVSYFWGMIQSRLLGILIFQRSEIVPKITGITLLHCCRCARSVIWIAATCTCLTIPWKIAIFKSILSPRPKVVIVFSHHSLTIQVLIVVFRCIATISTLIIVNWGTEVLVRVISCQSCLSWVKISRTGQNILRTVDCTLEIGSVVPSFSYRIILTEVGLIGVTSWVWSTCSCSSCCERGRESVRFAKITFSEIGRKSSLASSVVCVWRRLVIHWEFYLISIDF